MSDEAKPLRRWEYQMWSTENYVNGGFPVSLYDSDVDRLNAEGAAGWEFVSWVVIGETATGAALMKREIAT